ncbi:MAG: class F sortase, partial [Candidatus Parcubacteria bacterium]|nr:class F sortase [Candidatus Parcubacteria bacterium]
MRSKIRTKIISRINLLIAVLLGLALFQAIIFSFWTPSNGQSPLKLPILAEKFIGSLKGKEIRSELPVRIKIPKIRIDTTLERVGLASDGSVGIPSGPGNAAWFELSPRPGEKGNAIITGHFGWKNGIPAV